MITDYQNWTSLITQTHMKKKNTCNQHFSTYFLLTKLPDSTKYNTHERETYLFYVIVAEQKPWRFCFVGLLKRASAVILKIKKRCVVAIICRPFWNEMR